MDNILKISADVDSFVDSCENELKEEFNRIDDICEVNSAKVISAFIKNKVSEVHLGGTTGYGYNDIGRDVIEDVFSSIFKSEDSLVRGQFVSGTHALTVALFAMLRPGDTMLSITGKPYDTLEEVIGIKDNASSLKSYGINYKEIELLNNSFDYEKIKKILKNEKIKLIEIQRSRGYSTRESIGIDSLANVIKEIREVDKEVIIMIDNCYCEFVSEREPIEVGADIVVGSLIKNLGGGIAPTGGYISGKKNLISLCADRLNSPGLGKEVGSTLGINRYILQGLFLSPNVVANSLKIAVLSSYVFDKKGYKVNPKHDDRRVDIVQSIEFKNPDELINFCRGIQNASPIDSYVTLEPWDMPGYNNKVIMASGSFIQGSSIELSCDAPIRKPYIAYLQGGLTYEYGKIGIKMALENISRK